MDNIFEIRQLSSEFYNVYDNKQFPEIMYKLNRPYIVLVAKIGDNTFAIPFRTDMNHNNGYKFTHSKRKSSSVTGLDFSKAVIINNSQYIGVETNIDDLEYTELNEKIRVIIGRFTKYLNDYKKYVAGKLTPYRAGQYKFTTLKYFHKELGIVSENENKYNT